MIKVFDSVSDDWDEFPLRTRPPYTFDNLPEPWIIAHRGGEDTYPEECIWTYNKTLADFAQHAPDVSVVLEADVHMLKLSGDLLVNHDDTLDRTTDGTGTVGGTTGVRTLADYKKINVDQFSWLGVLFEPASDLKMVTVREFLERYGSRGCVTFHCKYTQTRAPLLALIQEYQAERTSLIYADSVGVRDFFVNAGVRTNVVGDAQNLTTAAEYEALGILDVAGWVAEGPNEAADWATAEAWVGDTAVKFFMGGNRRADWQRWRQHADVHRGGYTDHPLWVSGRSPVYTTDQFAQRIHLPGHVPHGSEYPGRFVDLGNGVWGWSPLADTNGWCLFGQHSPHPKGGHGVFDIFTGEQETKQPEYPFGWEVDITHFQQTTSNLYASMAFANDDRDIHDSRQTGTTTSGRHVLFFFVNQDGAAWLIDIIDDVETVLLFNWPVGAIPLGSKHRFRLEYLDATHMKVTDLTAGLDTTVTIPANLGTNGYLHMGTPDSGTGTGAWAFSQLQLI